MIGKLILGNPWVFGILAAVLVSLAGWGFLEHEWRQAAEKGEAAALKELASATERANSNHDAAEIMRLQIEADKRTIALQGDEIDRWKADSLALKLKNDQLVRAGRQEAERRLAELQAKEEEALAHPEDIHLLSPRVRAVAGGLSSE